MELFDKKYVHFIWEDELEGKEGFFSDNINELQKQVNFKTSKLKLADSNDYQYPFFDGYNNYKFFYYDPNHLYKKAYAEGKQIQSKSVYSGNEWIDCEKPNWEDDVEYRIKPEEPKARRMTHRELAEWLAKGNGQRRFTDNGYAEQILAYPQDIDNKELSDDYRVRRWGSDEWIEPLESVYMEDCK